MILDDLTQAARYDDLNPGFRLGFEFLRRADLASLASGRHEIDGDRVFALVNRDPGRGHAGARLEAHRKYIDIQYLVDGHEEIGWRPTVQCAQVTEPYDADRDIMFFGDAPQTWIALPRGKYMIFFSDDAHAPLAATGPNTKVVIKVAV
ncbi:MAG: YhcH/YjgK/YiaL family protein [Pirellulales bacterium]